MFPEKILDFRRKIGNFVGEWEMEKAKDVVVALASAVVIVCSEFLGNKDTGRRGQIIFRGQVKGPNGKMIAMPQSSDLIITNDCSTTKDGKKAKWPTQAPAENDVKSMIVAYCGTDSALRTKMYASYMERHISKDKGKIALTHAEAIATLQDKPAYQTAIDSVPKEVLAGLGVIWGHVVKNRELFERINTARKTLRGIPSNDAGTAEIKNAIQLLGNPSVTPDAIRGMAGDKSRMLSPVGKLMAVADIFGVRLG